MAIISEKLLSLTVLKGESAPFLMELPPYRLPTLKSVLLTTRAVYRSLFGKDEGCAGGCVSCRHKKES